MALFVIPLGLKLVGSVLAVTGVFKTKSAYDKISGSKEKIAEAKDRHDRNVKKFKIDEDSAIKAMDRLGELEIKIMASFQEYSDVMGIIYDRPVFEKGKSDNNEIPLFKSEDFKQASEGANTLLGGIGSAAAGAFASYAASGAITATTAAFTASGLSGAAAANTVFATLGGGAIAAGGGGIELGSIALGYSTFGIGLLIGSYFFESNADKSVKNADEAFDNMLKAEEKISKCCNYLNDLKEYSERYEKALQKLFEKYRVELEKVKKIVDKNERVNYFKLTKSERLMVENLIRIVDVLYKMCNVQFVQKAKTDDEPNNVNTEEINIKLDQAKNEFPDVFADVKEKEAINFPDAVYVICGETKTYRNKIIKFDATIECAGELTFENCEIYYHRFSNTDKGQIKLIDDAKLEFKNCVLHCEAYSDIPLISSVPNHGNPSVYVSNSEFYDCSELIASEYPAYNFKYISLENSKFYNCINLMKRVEIKNGYHCRIANCKFEYKKIADFYVRYRRNQKEGILNEFINVSSGDFYLVDSKVDFSKDVCETMRELRGIRGNWFIEGPDSYYYSKFRVKNTSFTGCQNLYCLAGVDAVDGCSFQDCSGAIFSLRGVADNCQFNHCKLAFYAYEGAVIRKCLFNGWDTLDSNDSLLSFTTYSGTKGFLIENCTFQNIRVKESTGLIEVQGDKTVSKYLTIEKSIFRDIVVEPTSRKFISYELEMPSGIIEPIKFLDAKKKEIDNKQSYISFESCEFINCKGNLVNCEAYWTELNMFLPDDSGITKVVKFTNCKGIESNGKASNNFIWSDIAANKEKFNTDNNYTESYKTMSIDELYREGLAYAHGGRHVKDMQKAADYYYLADKKSMEYRGYHHDKAQRSLEILEHNYYIKPLCKDFM